MTDISSNNAVSAPAADEPRSWGGATTQKRLRRRYAADWRLRAYGLTAILVALGMLATLFTSLISTGYQAFTTTKVNLSIVLDPSRIDAENPGAANYRGIVRSAFLSYFPEVTSRTEQREVLEIMSSGAPFIVRNYVLRNPESIGQTIDISVPLSDPFDQLYKGIIPREIDALSFDRVILFDQLRTRNVLAVVDGRAVVAIDAYIDPARVPRDQPASGNFAPIIEEGLKSYFPDDLSGNFAEMVGPRAAEELRDRIVANPDEIGRTIRFNAPLEDRYAQLLLTGESKIRNPRFSSDKDFQWFDSLVERGLVSTPFTWELFTNADSRFPEMAGLAGALTGSALALLVCFLLSFPIGIASAVYLEEFAPKNRWSDLIEVNINNLAAVPSIVFGLLGLAVFLNAFGLPRSAPLVGGMVLALMTLPTIIVATRAALKSVPPSIREAALGVGASKHQMIVHHVLPLAMPGILTGTIIGLAQALGETAPLLLIGMNAFIPSIENMGVLEPAMALPTQIFAWADSPERGFVSRTSAAILVLLGFLILMNTAAVLLRSRLERKW